MLLRYLVESPVAEAKEVELHSLARGIFPAMRDATKRAAKPSMDSAGRIVLPKAIREQAGLKPGQPLELRYENGRVEIEPAYLEVEIVPGPDGLPVLRPMEPVPVLSAEEVRATLEKVRDRLV